jgi:hypothetical protein
MRLADSLHLTVGVDRWNRHLCDCLARSLPVLEEAAVRSVHLRADEQPYLQELAETYRLLAVPVQCPLWAGPQLLDSVRQTGLWNVLQPDAEFGLAVEVIPYPAGVMAAWVYLAVMTPRD